MWVNVLDLSTSGEGQISDSYWEVEYLYSAKETSGIATRSGEMLPVHGQPIPTTFGTLRITQAET